MKIVYALLCVFGLAAPYFFLAPFLFTNGVDLPAVMSQLAANPVSRFFGADVIVSSVVLWAFVYQETRRRRIALWWLAIVANLAVGVSLGLPLFLWLRELAIEHPDGLHSLREST